MDSVAEPQNEKRPNRLLFKHVLRKIFLEDWLLKAVALAITLVLWLGVTGLSTPTTELIRNVPLNLRFSSETEITGSELQQVDIIVSGDKRRVSEINRNDLVVSVDLTDVENGERVLNLTPENVLLSLPTGVKLDEIQPSTITVKLEPMVEKEVPVRIETAGTLPDGFEIYSQTISPTQVKVRGPASYILPIESLMTERIDLGDRRTDFTAQGVQLNRPGTEKITLLKGVVDVMFRVGETRTERVFLLPVENLFDRKATVVLYGPRSVITSLKPEELKVTSAKDATGTDVPQVTLPAQMQNVEIRQVRLRP
jgi:Uncharacterized protein conserved in bacteria